MNEYLHGAYGDSRTDGNRVTANSEGAIVVIGTAPVHTLALNTGEEYPVNKPLLINNMAEAKRYLGYSDDWASYTLCEAMHHFFETKGVGPLIFINVLDPKNEAHKDAVEKSVTKTPVNNVITLADAEKVILESVTIDEKEKGTDFVVSYSSAKKMITIKGVTELGVEELTVKYSEIKPDGVKDTDVIGKTDGLGTNTGVFAVRNVYPMTGIIPAYMIAPGFSSVPTVHNAMIQNSQKVGGHWDMWVFADLPLEDKGTPLTMETAAKWKKDNGYTNANETVYYPMAEGADGNKYHLSVLAAANFLELLGENEGIPYHSASNTDVPIVTNLWMGEKSKGKVFDDEIINERLNQYGIASAAYLGGRWAIWGAHSAQYGQDENDNVNVAETNLMMLYYVSNDFQARRPKNVDQPLTANDIQSIVAEEQNRLDALKAMGALIYGTASLDAESLANSDVFSGDYVFDFRVTTTPLAKSLKAVVTWVDDGFSTYFATGAAD